MNRVIFFFALVINVNLLISQNWKPINAGEKYNYQIDTSYVISNTIWVDSVALLGSDSVYYLNRIAKECDTCNAQNQYPIIQLNIPQFLKNEVAFANDGIYVFKDTSEFIINSLSTQGESWLYDSINNISATVTSVSNTLIFNTLDSIKTILLSTGDTIILSKSFGIIQFPAVLNSHIYFRLKGIDGLGLGQQIPDFWDFYNFEVGDVFEYSGNIGWPEFWDMWTKKYTINSKQITDSSYIYDVHYILIKDFMDFWGYYSQIYSADTVIVFQDSINHIANKYQNEFARPCWSFTRPEYNWCWDDDNFGYLDSSFVLVQFDTLNGNIIKKLGETVYTAYPQYDNEFAIMNLQFEIGLGITYSDFMRFEQGGREFLEGYVKNGDTTGIVKSDGFLLSNKIIGNAFDNVVLYPNPANSFVDIKMPVYNKSSQFIAYIYNISGEEIKAQKCKSDNSRINLEGIDDGIYLIKLISENKVTIKKLIIQH